MDMGQGVVGSSASSRIEFSSVLHAFGVVRKGIRGKLAFLFLWENWPIESNVRMTAAVVAAILIK